jgi:hypothetical protein
MGILACLWTGIRILLNESIGKPFKREGEKKWALPVGNAHV